MLASKMETVESETLIVEVEEMNGRADVTLDPDTANPFLILASDQRGVGRGHEWTLLPNNPERFDTEPCVLGSQAFAAGRHCWEVEVAEAGDWWAVGVAQESVRRKGVLNFMPQEGIWAVGQWFGQYHAFSEPDWTPLHLTCLPRAIQVCLDFTDKQTPGDLLHPAQKPSLLCLQQQDSSWAHFFLTTPWPGRLVYPEGDGEDAKAGGTQSSPARPEMALQFQSSPARGALSLAEIPNAVGH
uniref:E3 ubiquitin-protein ligase TRIM7-like isoform X1 n=1 Tax=Agelaius phoeniceus TaxID=39638 RepID=UPI0023EE1F84|nr:E3 ubiquitin-protein ligase TRIM7-like isoform X1 [Agelaius phoeniceus]XP_054506179.1 E3 ubiquitin-protein ligase TRIM7-like isoform X1 [Agelaius phoeniceus]